MKFGLASGTVPLAVCADCLHKSQRDMQENRHISREGFPERCSCCGVRQRVYTFVTPNVEKD